MNEHQITDKFVVAMAKYGIEVLSVSFDREYHATTIKVPTKEQADKLANLLFKTPETFQLQEFGDHWLVRVDIFQNLPDWRHS